MDKKFYIDQLKDGLVFDDFFVVKFKKPIIKYSKGYRFEVRLADKTGEIMLKFWGSDDLKKIEEIYNSFKKDNVIFIKNIKVSKYNNRLELNINEDSKIQKIENYNRGAIIETTSKDIKVMIQELKDYINNVEDTSYLKILNTIFSDDFINKFSIAPAAMYMHHGYIGGLIEHTLNVCKHSLNISKDYDNLDKDLIITGALLHDIGKLDELDIKSSINVTKKGHMIGHISLGASKILNVCKELNIEEDKKVKLLNIILSHHGCKEYGSPKDPATPEALLISLIDNLDAKLKRIIKIKNKANTEDDFFYNAEFGNIFLK